MHEIILTSISTGGAIIAAIISALIVSARNRAVFELRLDQLEKKQDKHNQLIERMSVAEQAVKSAHHRIDELK
jgi:hypothetical protein